MAKKLTYEEVHKLFEDKGYTLISTEYRDSQTPLEYKCTQHPNEVRKIRIAKLNSGQGCSDCAKEKSRKRFKLDFEDVRKMFEDRGYVLLETEYKNNHTPMRYTCPKHTGERTITYQSLRNGRGCERCGRERMKEKQAAQGYPALKKARENRAIPFSQVVSAFEDKGLIVLTAKEDFVNTLHPIKFICPKHPDIEQEKVYYEVHSLEQGCRMCGIERRSGENSPRWKAELTEEDREYNRSTKLKRLWVKTVFEKDGYTCQKCHKVGGSLEAHHKDGWNWCKVRRYDISNGVALCKQCHSDFHDKYGRGDNTEEQYKEWI